jgi:hypothetical protein
VGYRVSSFPATVRNQAKTGSGIAVVATRGGHPMRSDISQVVNFPSTTALPDLCS